MTWVELQYMQRGLPKNTNDTLPHNTEVEVVLLLVLLPTSIKINFCDYVIYKYGLKYAESVAYRWFSSADRLNVYRFTPSSP